MVYFLQRENNTETQIPSGAMVAFDAPIAQSDEGFVYHKNGCIDIQQPGIYTVFWHVSSKSSLSSAGHSCELRRQADSDWTVLTGTGSHIKNSQMPGFAILVVRQEELDAEGYIRIALFNAADEPIICSDFTPKAGIMIFGLDMESVDDNMTQMNEEMSALSANLQQLEEFVHFSEALTMMSETEELLGLGTSVITSGYTHNFWGIGALNHLQNFDAGAVYYLLRAEDYPPLERYQGDSTIGTLWVETSDSSPEISSFPIRFDAAGIYFRFDSSYSFPVGSTFKFTQALILAEPEVS